MRGVLNVMGDGYLVGGESGFGIGRQVEVAGV